MSTYSIYRCAPLLLMLAAGAAQVNAQCVVPGSLIITEVFYNALGDDDQLEWIELRNDSNSTIVLTGNFSLGWGGVNYLVGQLDLQGSIAPGETFVVGGPISANANGFPVYQQSVAFSSNLPNAGPVADGVALFAVPAASVTESTAPLDVVIYGEANDNGLIGPGGVPIPPHVGNAPAGSSIERVDAGWQIQPVPMPNQATLAGPQSPLVISEVFYNALGPDVQLEWAELFNRGTTPILLDGNYSLGAGGLDYTFDQQDLQGTIAPGATFVVGGPVSSPANASPMLNQPVQLNLPNGGVAADGVALFDFPMAQVSAATIPVDTVIYGESNSNLLIDPSGSAPPPDVGNAPPGSSIERDLAGWLVQAAPTPNVTPLVVTGCRAFADGFETQ